jgi:hypothetical protein
MPEKAITLSDAIEDVLDGEYEEARNKFKILNETNANNESFWLWRSVSASSKKWKCRYLEFALKINPDNQEAAEVLAQIKPQETHPSKEQLLSFEAAEDNKFHKQITEMTSNIQSIKGGVSFITFMFVLSLIGSILVVLFGFW